jgi:hypothetical protein
VGWGIRVYQGERQRQVVTKTLRSEIYDRDYYQVMISVITVITFVE